MKILAICASPRKDGNTQRCLEAVLDEARSLGAETQLITLCDKQLKGCRGCYGCVKEKACVEKDDFQAIFAEMCGADGIIFGTPTYHASMTAELKALLDRAGFSGRWAMNSMKSKSSAYDWGGCVFSGKVVAPVTVARRTGQTMAFAEILLWAACNDCVIVGNTYWNMAVAGKGGAIDAENDTEGAGIMKGLGQRMVRVIKQMNK